jgi:hypothetical protein
MSEHNIYDIASWAGRLKKDDAFCYFVKQIRDEQLSLFLNSGRDDTETREAAHEILRALDKIEGTLDTAISAKTFADKKDQHRGND